ncbi:MAG: ABC transporter substrate-binding protein, partial [Proteobacteria bacterium]|nr:ABC transporter substrate-binding protein [Pseudomonadota bacterium]
MYLKKLFQILVLIGLLSNSFIEVSAVEVAQSPSFNSDTIVLQLRWKHQFQFAGYYAAKEMGFYKEAGLNVEIKEGGLNIDTVEEVIENRAQYGVTNSEILLHRLNGKPLVVLAAILQHSPLVLLTSRVGEITNPQDLVNRTVKMSLHPRDIELHAMFRNEGVSLNQINILDYPITYSDYFDSKLDAISAYITNEPYFLMLENRPYSVIKPASYGIDFYGDCFFTSEKEINDNPNRVEAFKAASIKGWHYALQHPEELIHIIRTKYNSSKSLEHMRYEAESIKKLIVPDLVEIGHMNKGRWASIANVFMQFDMIPKDYNMEGFIYQPVSSKESRRLKWLARIMFLILVAVGFVAVILYIFNKRLQKEIKERMLSETA